MPRRSGLHCVLTGTPAPLGNCPVHGGADCVMWGRLYVVPLDGQHRGLRGWLARLAGRRP